jgi:AcrR family transcriptional regulator
MTIGRKEPKNSTVRNPVQVRGIKTKEKIIRVGQSLIAARGYHNVTADEIAYAAGVSVGTFYAYFVDKRDLFLTGLDNYIKTCNTLVIEGIDAFASIEKADITSSFLKIISLHVAVHRADAPFLNEVLKMSLEDSEVKQRLDGVGTQITAFIEAVLIQTGIEGIIHEIALGWQQIDENAVFAETAHLFTAYVNDMI